MSFDREMKISNFLLLLVVWAFGTVLHGEDPKKVKNAFSGDWSVIRISHYHFMGDFDREYPVIFFQRLPDKRILLSTAVQKRWGRLIPKPVKFIETEKWMELETEILNHYSKAYNSDPDAQIRKNGFGSDFRSIEISVSALDTKQFSHRFSQVDGSAKQFREFLERLVSPLTEPNKTEMVR